MTSRHVDSDAIDDAPVDAPRPSEPPHSPRWPVPLLVAVGIVVVSTCWLLRPDPGPQPVVETTLETSGLGKILSGGRNWRDLPFRLDSAEREDLATCLRLAGEVGNTANGVAAFATPEVRTQLEAVLARRPDYFYAESLLALWHSLNGARDRSRGYHALALDHAPVVLVQRYEFADGRPLAGAKIETFQVECNRVRNGSLDPTLKLTYFDLVTDADGTIRVPAYDTVYRLFNTSHPEGYAATYPRLGWFEVEGRVGVLPAAKMRPAED